MFSLARIEATVRHLLRFGASPADAQDLAQEVLVLAWQKRSEVAAEELDAWMYGAAKNVYRNFMRADRRAKVKLSPDGELEQPAEATPHGMPEDAMALQAAVRALPAHQQDVVWLHELEGYTLQETAARLEAPVDTVKDRLKRAREALRVKLADYPDLIGGERAHTRGVARVAAAAVLAGFVSNLSSASAAPLATSAEAVQAAGAGVGAQSVAGSASVGWGWLAVGALAGSALTFGGMTWQRASVTGEPPVAHASWAAPLFDVGAPPAPTSDRTAVPVSSTPVVVPATRHRDTPGDRKSALLVPHAQAAAVDPEVQLLEQARNALRDGRTDDALIQLTAHERSFAKSQLAEERDVLVIQCHIRSRDISAARAAIAYYNRQYPRGVLRSQVADLERVFAAK